MTMGFCSRNQEKQFIHPTNPNHSPTQHRSKHPTDREHRVRAEGIGLKPIHLLHASYIQILDGLGDVELVHGGNDDCGRGEEEEQNEEDAVDDKTTDPPGDPAQ